MSLQEKNEIIYEFDFNKDINKDEKIIPVFMQYENECFEFINDSNALTNFLELFYFKLAENEKYNQILDEFFEKKIIFKS